MSKTYSAKDVQRIQQIAYETDIISLNALINTENDDKVEIGALIADTNPTPEELMIQKDRRDLLMKYFAEYLTPRETEILTLRFGLDNNTSRTLSEIGEYFGLTRERIRQIEKKALKKLATRFARQKIKLEDIL